VETCDAGENEVPRVFVTDTSDLDNFQPELEITLTELVQLSQEKSTDILRSVLIGLRCLKCKSKKQETEN
jgi:hypothetical protein